MGLEEDDLRLLGKDGNLMSLPLPEECRDKQRIEKALQEGISMLAVIQYVMGNMLYNGCKEDNRKTFD